MLTPANLVHETSTSTGTGNITLSNVAGKQSFNTAFSTGGTNVFDYYISNRAAAEWERGTGHLSASNTLVRDTVIESSNANAAVNFTGGTKDVTNDVPAGDQVLPGTFVAMVNGIIVESRPGNVATYAVKHKTGVDPSVAKPVHFIFNDGAGGYVIRTVTAALSGTLSVGSNVGVSVATTPFSLYISAVDNAGAVLIGLSVQMTSAGVKPLNEGLPVTTTAEGGVGAADSSGVIYTSSAVSAKYFRVLARADYDAGLATPGTWNVAPSRIVLMTPRTPRPGDVIQSVGASYATQENTGSTTYVDTSLTASITPNPCNGIQVSYNTPLGQSVANVYAYTQMRRGGSQIGGAKGIYNATGLLIATVSDSFFDRPGSGALQTYTLAYRTDATGTAVHCPNSLISTMSLVEVQG